MPELPEVETVRKSLKRNITGKTIKQVAVHYRPMVKTTLKHFNDTLKDRTVIDIKRFGKFLVIDLDGIYLVSHLRMEGKYFMKPENDPKEKHEHLIITFEDGLTLRYHDVRKFGTFHIKTPKTLHTTPPLIKLGVEYDAPAFNVAYLKERFENRIRPLKPALLDQSHVTGIGNIYADEICFCLGFHPATPVGTLDDTALERLITCTKKVLDKAVRLGGASIRSYKDGLGITGRFQNELNVHLQAGKSCVQCGEKIIKIKLGGRGTYLCPECQRLK